MNPPNPRPRLATLFLAGLATLATLATLAGCGDGGQPAKPATGAAAKPAAPAARQPVSETDHQRFEKKYAELCIKGQHQNPDSPVKDDQALGGLCGCMAKEVSKRLSKAEVVHFLDKKEMPIELVMLGNSASDLCSQGAK